MKDRKEIIETLKKTISTLQNDIEKLENKDSVVKKPSPWLLQSQKEERNFYMNRMSQEDLERLEVEHAKERKEDLESPRYSRF